MTVVLLNRLPLVPIAKQPIKGRTTPITSDPYSLLTVVLPPITSEVYSLLTVVLPPITSEVYSLLTVALPPIIVKSTAY